MKLNADVLCVWVWYAGVEAMEVHREGGKHGEGRHKDAGEEVVGDIRG